MLALTRSTVNWVSSLQQQPPLGAFDGTAGRFHGVGVHRDGRDAKAHQMFGELGVV